MFKQRLLIISFLLTAIFAKAQTKQLRYKDLVFPDADVTEDLSYAPADSASSKEKNSYLFDLYQPKGDNATMRPLIIWMHGGGFKFGSKEAKGIKLWSKTFAQRGYVCAAINYRLSKKNPLFHYKVLVQASYYACQDAKMAVRFFRTHAKEYNIDPDKIVLGGNSAGGMIAMQTAYSTDTEFSKFADLPPSDPDTKGVFKVAAVINFWGAIYRLKWLDNAKVPIVSTLGSKDGLISPTHKDTALYGGIDIHHRADELAIPNQLKVFDGYSHELQQHFNPFFSGGKDTQGRWLQAGQFAADFLYKVLYKN